MCLERAKLALSDLLAGDYAKLGQRSTASYSLYDGECNIYLFVQRYTPRNKDGMEYTVLRQL